MRALGIVAIAAMMAVTGCSAEDDTKASREAPIQLTNQYGTPIYLAPGNTWVELVPNARGGSVAVV